MASKKRKVRIVSCADDKRAAGKTGWIVDEGTPGELTQGRWTVHVDAFWIADVLCDSSEITPID